MRLSSSLLLSLLAAAPPSAAQAPPAQDGWHLGGGVDALRFGHVAVNEADPGLAAEVRPSSRAALRLVVGRKTGLWNVSLEAGWAEGNIQVGNDVVSVQDLTSDVTRYRLALAVGRELGTLGTGRLGAELAPAADLWSVTGESRVRAGVELCVRDLSCVAKRAGGLIATSPAGHAAIVAFVSMRPPVQNGVAELRSG
jgi:hypothetical protein